MGKAFGPVKNETNALRSVLFFITRRFPASFSQVPTNLSISETIFHPFKKRFRTTLFLLHPCFPHQSIQHGLFFGCSLNLSMRALRVVRTSPCASSVGQHALHFSFDHLSAASRANLGLFRRSTVSTFGLWAFSFHFVSLVRTLFFVLLFYFPKYLAYLCLLRF